MRTYSFDWATKKALTVFDSKTQKVKQIPNSIKEFEKFLGKIKEPSTMLFEFGGGDTFKIMAFRAGHTILQIPGKKIKDYRDRLGKEKSDEIDARLIYDFYIKNDGGGAEAGLRNSDSKMPSSTENKGRGVGIKLSTRIGNVVPSPFFLYKEQDAEISEIKILYREHENIKLAMVREKNQLFAFKIKFKIARVADDRIAKTKEQKQTSIMAKERQLQTLKKILEKKIEAFPIWAHYKDTKGIGPTIVAGLIGELGGREFESKGSLKHYAGMIPRADSNDCNRKLKQVLFQFAEQVIKQRIPHWRELYDSMKIYYAKKHEDWRPGKIDAYAKKFIEKKFLVEFFGNLRGGAVAGMSNRISGKLPASQSN